MVPRVELFVCRLPLRERVGMGLRFRLEANYADICDLLGEPDPASEDGKVQAQWYWTLDGCRMGLWDYKETRPATEVTVWSMYSASQLLAELFASYVGGKLMV